MSAMEPVEHELNFYTFDIFTVPYMSYYSGEASTSRWDYIEVKEVQELHGVYYFHHQVFRSSYWYYHLGHLVGITLIPSSAILRYVFNNECSIMSLHVRIMTAVLCIKQGTDFLI
jgi:hypothetical protein